MTIDRRHSPRTRCSGLVSITVKAGKYRGASFVGLLQDIGDGGVAVLLDGGQFVRGTEVEIEVPGAPSVAAWVCHSATVHEGCRVGMSFHPVRAAMLEECWEPALCRNAAI